MEFVLALLIELVVGIILVLVTPRIQRWQEEKKLLLLQMLQEKKTQSAPERTKSPSQNPTFPVVF